jgi:hypothetical protein
MLVISNMDGERCINDVRLLGRFSISFFFVKHCHIIELIISVSYCNHS